MPRSTESSAPSDRCSYAAGDLIADKYLLEQLLDEGGMGSVWVARNVDLDARVAVKLLRSSSVHFGAAERLKREARVEARLDLLNLADASYEIRNGTGVGVGAPQYGIRRTVLTGVTVKF